MSRLKDGYPDYLIRVDHDKMRIRVIASCAPKDAPVVKATEEDGYEDDWVAYPAEYAVCPNCRGKGSHVNRAIDGNGLTREDFEEDPDFMEDYLNGVYDVPCDECQGMRVVLRPSTEEGQKVIDKLMRGYYADRAEEAAERRMGA